MDHHPDDPVASHPMQPLRRSMKLHHWLNNDTYAAIALAAATVVAQVWAHLGGRDHAFGHPPIGFILRG
ncbi:MAG: Na+/H+ antiporter NhaA, partial [Acidipropionibacterium jensenii]|nr:Na+/H+ antiporter NhaA [Acidipropionibacterium jensenii]